MAGLTKKRSSKKITLKNYREFLPLTEVELKKIYMKQVKLSSSLKTDYGEILFTFLKLYHSKGLCNDVIEISEKILKNKGKYFPVIGNQESLIQFYLGESFKAQGNARKAKYHYEKAAVQVENLSNLKANEDFVKGLSAELRYANNSQRENILKLLVRIFNSAKDRNFKARAASVIGYYSFISKKWQSAIKYFKESLCYCENIDNGTASMYYNLALSYKNVENFKEALIILNKAEEGNEDDLGLYARIQLLKAIIRLRMGKKGNIAEHLLLNARKIFKDLGCRKEYLTTVFHLCRCYSYLRNFNCYSEFHKELVSLTEDVHLGEKASLFVAKLEQIKRDYRVKRIY